MTRWCCSTSTGEYGAPSRRAAVALGVGGLRTVAGEYARHLDRARPPRRSAAPSRTRAAASCLARPSPLTNTGTKAVQTTVSDDRGQYLFGGLFPGTYDLKVELSGFKTYEQKALALSPNDTAASTSGSKSASRPRPSPSPRSTKSSRRETGAREGVLTAKQIDNLSVIGRSALELLRILPGVVTEFNQGESVSFGGGGNNTQGYTVNGIRSSGNTVSLDGSSLIDIGSNSGVIVSLNNDMVQEVKVQSSNFAAEYGTGGMNVSGVTKSGSSKFHGSAYDYWRDYKFAANDRSNSIAGTREAEEQVSVSGRQRRRPDRVRRQLHQEPRPAVLLRRLRRPAAAGRLGLALHAHLPQAMRNGDFSELLANRGSNLNSIPQLRIPQGFPDAGQPAPNNNMRAVHRRRLGKYFASLYPLPNYNDPNNLYNYVYSALEPTNRTDFKSRFDWNISNSTKAYVRVAQRRRDGREPARRVVGARRTSWRCRRRTSATNTRPLVSPATSSSVLSPSMTNEALVSYSRLTLDNHFKDPSLLAQGAGGITFNGIFPAGRRARTCRPTCSTAGAAAARSATCGRRRTTCTRTTTRCSSATS